MASNIQLQRPTPPVQPKAPVQSDYKYNKDFRAAQKQYTEQEFPAYKEQLATYNSDLKTYNDAVGAQTTGEQQTQKLAGQSAQDLRTYRNSTTGMVMDAAQPTALALGIPLGYGVAGGLVRPLQTLAGNRKNARRAGIAADFDAIDQSAPDAAARNESLARSARLNNLIPEAGSSGVARRYLPYGLAGLGLAGEGLYQRLVQAQDPNNTPFQTDSTKTASNALLGAGATLLAGGAKYADNPGTVPDASAIGKMLLAEKLGQPQTQPQTNALNPPQPPEGEPPVNQNALNPPQPEASRYAGQRPSDAARMMSGHLGINAANTKADTAQLLMDRVDSADPGTLRSFAAGIPGVDETGKIASVRSGLKAYIADNIANNTKRLSAIFGPLAAGGLAAYDASTSPADASTADKIRDVAQTVGYGTPGVQDVLAARDAYNAMPSSADQSVVDNPRLAVSQTPEAVRNPNPITNPRQLIAQPSDSVRARAAQLNIEAAQADQQRQIEDMQRQAQLNSQLRQYAPQPTDAAPSQAILNMPQTSNVAQTDAAPQTGPTDADHAAALDKLRQAALIHHIIMMAGPPPQPSNALLTGATVH